jgi:site-specific recombinase XerD
VASLAHHYPSLISGNLYYRKYWQWKFNPYSSALTITYSVLLMSTIKPPIPFFDTLDEMPNPYRQRVSSVAHLRTDDTPDAIADYQYASEFLYSYRGSKDTFSTYRRELEHFLHWSWLVSNKPLRDIRRDDIEAYIEFARKPPKSWIGEHNVPRFLDSNGLRQPNPDWRPYIVTQDDQGAGYNLTQSGIQSIFAVLSSFFNFLIQEDYLEANPVAQIRQKSKFVRKSQMARPIRRLSELQWSYVIDTAEDLAKNEPIVHERTLFVMNALFGMYLRISELVETDRWKPRMGDFERDIEGNWWFRTVGKGNKERIISVSDSMLGALRRYRRSRGLAELPAPGESSPLIHRNRGSGGITSTRQIRLIVQHCFDTARNRMHQEGHLEEAQQLEAATVHWLRHTGISEDVKFRPREHVRDDAGHGSSAITDRYIDVELKERHASARKKIINPGS